MDNNKLTKSTASSAAHPATTASAPTTTTTTVPFDNNAPVESNGTAILVPAILEPHPINVGDMLAPAWCDRWCYAPDRGTIPTS